MAQNWTKAENQRLSDLVVRFRFNFTRISEELGRSEEDVRVHWTELFLANKQKPSEDRKLHRGSSLPVKEITEIQCPEIDYRPSKSSVLDTEGVDFTQQTSRSITGEIIHPSGFNIFKHSLKDAFQEIFDRMHSFVPRMEFPSEEDEGETEPISYKISFKSGQPAIESKRGTKGKWQPTVLTVPLPTYDDINPIPEGDRPVRPATAQVPLLTESDEVTFRAVDAPVHLRSEFSNTEKELAKLFNLTDAELKSELEQQQTRAPTRADTIKGRVRVHQSDSDHDSDEEEKFLAAQRKAMKKYVPRPAVPKTEIESISTGGPALEELESEETDVMAVPTPYPILRQIQLEQKAESFRELQILKYKEEQEKAELKRKEEEKEIQEEINRRKVLQEEENLRLQEKREAKIKAKIEEEIKRKAEIMKVEAEMKLKLEQEQRKNIEKRIKSTNSVHFFDSVTSFESPFEGFPSETRVKIVGIEDKPYIWPLILHFLGNSSVFGKVNTEESVSFKLVGLVRGLFGTLKSELSFNSGSPQAYWFLAFDLSSSSIGFNAYLEGFPLAYIIPGGVPGKTFLKEIVLEWESILDRHLILPIETIFTATPSFYPYNDCKTQEFEYAFAVMKPHSDPQQSVEMLGSLYTQGKNRGLDLAGCRIVQLTEKWKQGYEERFTKTLGGVETVLVLCWYGYNAVEQLHDILGAETPDLARKTDPGSIRAVYGESKDRNCVYTAKLQQRVYKEMCVWFGGRVEPSNPVITLIQCPQAENAHFVLSPQTSVAELVLLLENLLKFGFSLKEVVRLNTESTVNCGFAPSKNTILGTEIRVEDGWLVGVSRPGASLHLTELVETWQTGRVVSEEEVSFLEPYTSPYLNLEALSSVCYLLTTPEAFIPTTDSFPVTKIAEFIASSCEILTLKVLTGPFPSEIEADYQDSLTKSSSFTDKETFRTWLEAGPCLLIAYLPDSIDSGKRLISNLQRNFTNSAFTNFTKPCFFPSNRSGKLLISPNEFHFDPSNSSTLLQFLPTEIPESSEFDSDLVTFCLVKPDKSFMIFRQLLKFLYRHEFKIEQMQLQILSENLVNLLYSHQKEAVGELNYEDFRSVLESGPCISMKLRRKNAVKRLKEVVGHPDPHQAEMNTLRGSYGKSPEDNKLHCSLSFAHARMEALCFFSGDEFTPVTVEDAQGIEEVTCAVWVLDDRISNVLEEIKKMQLVLADMRVTTLSESLLEQYMVTFPEKHDFAQAIYHQSIVAVLVSGLSPAYRLSTLLRSLTLPSHLPSSQTDFLALRSLFFPGYPY